MSLVDDDAPGSRESRARFVHLVPMPVGLDLGQTETREGGTTFTVEFDDAMSRA
jgi:hypothetical protein